MSWQPWKSSTRNNKNCMTCGNAPASAASCCKMGASSQPNGLWSLLLTMPMSTLPPTLMAFILWVVSVYDTMTNRMTRVPKNPWVKESMLFDVRPSQMSPSRCCSLSTGSERSPIAFCVDQCTIQNCEKGAKCRPEIQDVWYMWFTILLRSWSGSCVCVYSEKTCLQ